MRFERWFAPTAVALFSGLSAAFAFLAAFYWVDRRWGWAVYCTGWAAFMTYRAIISYLEHVEASHD